MGSSCFRGWYHLIENLHKVGGSLRRLRQAQALLWRGQVDATIALFADCLLLQAENFCDYLNKHRHRIVNSQYYQAEQICSIGSGAVESAVKQIDRRTKISGAQSNKENVPLVNPGMGFGSFNEREANLPLAIVLFFISLWSDDQK